MAEVTLSSKNQIVIPKEAREALDIKPGDKLVVTVMGDNVVIFAKPRSYAAAIRGMGQGSICQTTLKRNAPNLEWIPLDLKIADLAARLRGVHRLKAPDSVQAATAIAAQATLFITNDAVFERVKEFETLVLDRYL